MKILRKEGDNTLVVASAKEDVRVGDYLLAKEEGRSLVMQIYDERYFDLDGVEEEIMREEVLSASATGIIEDPVDLGSLSSLIRDMRILVCKSRGTIEKDKLTARIDWVPSRTSSTVSKYGVAELTCAVASLGRRKIKIGRVDSSSEFSINAEGLDGRITVITGRKESGKSHLAKMILRGLLEHEAFSIVFDLNDEYGTMGLKEDGTKSSVSSGVTVVRPGRELTFSLHSIGLRAIVSLLSHSLEMPGTSLREFVKIWDSTQSRGGISLRALEDAIQQWRCNEFVRDALHARYYTLVSSGLFSDSAERQFDLESFFASRRGGAVLVISLSGVSPLTRKMVVELILSKLVELLEQRKSPPIFLLAEEAHLYLRETYWEDLITRMRHFGVFSIFVTNQPDAIDQKIYRQVDNIFLYNFRNDSDLALVSQASMVDSDTIKAIVRTLPPRMCLALGHVVNNLPVVVSVSPFDSPSSGVTRRFFDSQSTTAAELRARA